MDIVAALLMLVLYIAVFIVVFLTLRSLWLWFFRINEIVDSLKEAVRSLKMIETALSKDKDQKPSLIQPISTCSVTHSPYVFASPSSVVVPKQTSHPHDLKSRTSNSENYLKALP